MDIRILQIQYLLQYVNRENVDYLLGNDWAALPTHDDLGRAGHSEFSPSPTPSEEYYTPGSPENQTQDAFTSIKPAKNRRLWWFQGNFAPKYRVPCGISPETQSQFWVLSRLFNLSWRYYVDVWLFRVCFNIEWIGPVGSGGPWFRLCRQLSIKLTAPKSFPLPRVMTTSSVSRSRTWKQNQTLMKNHTSASRKFQEMG